MTRRQVAAGAGLGLAGTLLAACAPRGGTGTASPEQAGPATLTMHSRTGDDMTHFVQRAEAFRQANPQITVTVEGIPNAEYNTKMTALQVAGSLGDTMWLSQFVGPFYPFAAARVTRGLDDLAKRDKYDLGQHFPNVLQAESWQGRLHGLPWLVHAGWSGLFVNEDLWQRNGQPLPTWDWTYEREFRAAAQRLTRGATDQGAEVYGFEVPFNLQAALTFIRSWGADVIAADGKRSRLTEPNTTAALTFVHDLMNVQHAAPRPDRTVPNGFATGRSASFCNGYFQTAGLQRQIAGSFRWRAYPMPKGPGGRGAFRGVDSISQSATSMHPDAAWRWIRFLVTKETGLIVARDRGSPGGRPDVWDDPSLTSDPNHQMFREWMKLVKPAQMPANARVTERLETMNAGLRDFYLGKQAPRQAIAGLHQQLQAILDKS